ncbi:3'-5' exonuclease [Erwinia sp. Leaf53]|uniref:3'-5' exonuclease n=1 Tax=Erwinia sp. Leaf53 TaxID=1736225 RepID=UPI0006F8FED8|nr:3'-5' exonuclease [Erwinia sp. Leaf53]KQN56753.1 ATPase [Erwinia sp. Leaf53]
MNHIMIDLETMGNKPNAAIVAVGAVFFDPATGEIGAQYSSPVLLASETTHGAAMDADTVIWWLQQSSEARAVIACATKSILVVLHELSIFVNEHSTARNVQVWGNGASFDNVILRSAYQRIGHPAFWPFWFDRDVRTMVELGRQIGIDPKRDTPFTGERHDALADAIHQAQYVSVIWQRLIPATSEAHP